VLGALQQNPWMQWENPRALQLLDRASDTRDPALRRWMFDDAHRLMIADVPMINLYGANVIDAVSKRVEGYHVWSAGKPRLWGIRLKPSSGASAP